MEERSLFGRPWAWLLLALVVLGIPLSQLLNRPPPLPDFGPMPAFTLVDQAGQPLSGADLRGAVVVADFIFTSCPDVCPALSHAMGEVQTRTAGTRVPVRLLSVSVDPERDTPAVLSSYGQRFGADPARWRLLTGPLDDVRALLKGMGQLAEKVPAGPGKPDDYNVAHGSSFLLYDPAGELRGIYGSNQDEIDRLVKDARGLAEL